MTNLFRFLAVLLFTVSANMAFAQDTTDESAKDTTTAAPVAFIYVANNAGSANEIYAYTAAQNGKLTLVPGSPFASGNVGQMVVNGKYLLGIDTNNTDIDSFLMEPDGALSLAETNNVSQYDAGSCSYKFGPITVDHTGKSLYNLADNSDCYSYQFESFAIAGSTGKLNYLGEGNTDDAVTQGITGPLAILGNNKFAYTAHCFWMDGEEEGGMLAYERNANGVLNLASAGIAIPSPPNSDDHFYCPYSNIATDPTNHVIVALQDQDFFGDNVGSPRLAIFTATSTGALTTNSTSANMVTPATNGWIRMAPSGKFLAVGSLEVFHFDGSKLTKYSDLSHYLRSEQISQSYWDNANHLYAIGATSSPGQGKLFVFTITPTSVTEAPGSPYSIPNPTNIAVQPRP